MWFKRKKKTKPKKDDKVKVFWHKEPVSFAHHDDDDEEEEVGDGTTTTATETNLTRSSGNTTTFSELSRTTPPSSSNTNNNNKSCIVSGMNLLHHNTELSLLSHVRNNVQQWDDTKHDTARSDVLHSIDMYCICRAWMMHCGPNKGDILIKALRSSMLYKRALLSTSWDYTRNINDSASSSSISCSSNNNDNNNTRGQFIAVELGTYCGYASILMGRLMHQIRNATMDCHLFTTEINPEYKQIATEMISMSGLDDIISVHQVRSCTTRSSGTTTNNNGYHNTNNYDDTNTDIVDVIWSAIEEYNTNNNNHKHHHHHQQQPKIDFLFIDHNKDSYKSDLQKLELSGMICRGTKVVADDALFVDIEDYVLYIQQRKDDGIVKTRTVPCKAVEYCGDDIIDMADYQDGVEITDYLQDPP